jgi:hypothetical protein
MSKSEAREIGISYFVHSGQNWKNRGGTAKKKTVNFTVF